MSEEDIIKDVVKEIVMRELGLPESGYNNTETIKSMGADSLDHIDLIMAFEDHYGFEIDDATAETIDTPRDIEKYLCEKLIGPN